MEFNTGIFSYQLSDSDRLYNTKYDYQNPFTVIDPFSPMRPAPCSPATQGKVVYVNWI